MPRDRFRNGGDRVFSAFGQRADATGTANAKRIFMSEPTNHQPEKDALLSALAWTVSMGADEAIGDAPVNA